MIKTYTITTATKGHTDTINITDKINEIIKESGLKEGSALIFIKHTTASLAITEYEPGIIRDLKEHFDILVPETKEYHHNLLNNDTNASSHIKALSTGHSLTIPFKDSKLLLGIWQQIVLIDFDNLTREREIVIQLNGEKEKL